MMGSSRRRCLLARRAACWSAGATACIPARLAARPEGRRPHTLSAEASEARPAILPRALLPPLVLTMTMAML